MLHAWSGAGSHTAVHAARTAWVGQVEAAGRRGDAAWGLEPIEVLDGRVQAHGVKLACPVGSGRAGDLSGIWKVHDEQMDSQWSECALGDHK
jgi:hypothetical protein